MKHLTTPADFHAFIDSFDTLLADMDGCILLGNTLIPGVDSTLAYLRSLGKRIIFVTNNSSKSRAAYVAKLSGMGLHGVTEDEIFGSSYAAACYLDETQFPRDKYVYMLGQEGMQAELEAQGFKTCGGLEDKDIKFTGMDDLTSIQPDPKVGAVLCGFDGWINYTKLAKAHTYLQDPNVKFLATNSDSTYPVGSRTFPGSGSLYTPLVASTGRHPVVLGKPHSTMLKVILDKYHLNPERTCMVGDRLDTDILFGKNGGCKTLLVMTGVTKEHTLMSEDNKIRPDFVLQSLGDLAAIAK
ncbi:4-nitrophenylphosphatase [Catenaria anguillulae PL171]|uniref:4-nitrophenylphosphatase n=1 Tax=Catenaria anguillulae PL171 TaxID=765915 RepID=A0A1Y2I1K3_9FUNG|nr:4-nitrophenylphosphatase [Catenaria anguillulae PL171]